MVKNRLNCVETKELISLAKEKCQNTDENSNGKEMTNVNIIDPIFLFLWKWRFLKLLLITFNNNVIFLIRRWINMTDRRELGPLGCKLIKITQFILINKICGTII